MDFDRIIGNDSIKACLKTALSAHNLPNTLLFAGFEGVGKGLFAKALAVLLTGTPQNREQTRHKILKGIHPDFHEYFPEGKAQLHSIRSMKELIEEAGRAPFEGRFKVFVIHDAERMLPTSANALLKILEEPASDSYIILLSGSTSELLPTIVSRCRTFNFSHVSEEQISVFLMKEHGKSSGQARLIAKMAHGSPAKAVEMSRHPEQDEKRGLLFDLLSKSSVDYTELHHVLGRLDSLCEKVGMRKETEMLFSQILMWYRDLHLLKAGGNLELLYFPESEQKSESFLPAMDKIMKAVDASLSGFKGGLKLSVCLERLFFDLRLVF